MQMVIGRSALHLFRGAIHLWVIVFILTSLPAYDALWLHPVSPTLPAPSVFGVFTHAFNTWAGGFVLLGVATLLLACTYQLLRPGHWLPALVIWMIYTSLMNRAWLAGSGGQQLISNMLFWLILIPAQGAKANGVIPQAAFWIMRLQLLTAYLVTALHKIIGTHWLAGTAMGIVSSDPDLGPAWLTGWPMAAMILTWAVLLFQFTFPIAVWWARTRIPWMIAGALFHLATAIWLGVPEMALAFLVCYPLWLSEREAGAVISFARRRVQTHLDP